MLGLATSRAPCLICYAACALIWTAMLLLPGDRFPRHMVRYTAPSLVLTALGYGLATRL